MTKLDLAQFERTCSDDMAQVDRVFLLAKCKRQREQIAKLREALDQFCRRVAPTGNVDARIVGAAFGERMQQTYSQARALLRELGEDA